MPTALGKIRLSMQAKVLLVVLGFLILFPLLMVWIVDRQTSELVQAQARQSLTTAEAVFRKTLEIRERNLLAHYRNVVIEPSFKAAATLTPTERDAATMADYLRQLLDQPGEEGEALLFYQGKGDLRASARREATFALDAFEHVVMPLVANAVAGEAGVTTGLWHGRAYTVIAMPVSLSRGGPVVGVLVSGIRSGDSTLREWRILTGTDIVLVGENSAIASTLPATAGMTKWLAQIAPTAGSHAQEVTPVVVGTEHYHALYVAEDPDVPTGDVRYVLMASYEGSVRALTDTRRTLLAVSLAGILMSVLAVWIFVRRITQPLRELRDSAEAVGRGDFSRRIERFSNDECGDLAVAFNGMTTSLRNSHTELKRALESLKATQAQLIQSEKLSAVGQFVAGVAHELNNPLTTVIGFADLLSSAETNEKNRRHLDLVAQSAHRCHKIVHSLLSFARQHAPERSLVGVNRLIDDVLEIMAYDLRTSNIIVTRKLGDNLPRLLADPHQLQQVFINILGNARQALEQFRRDGEIVIRTQLFGGVVRVEFQDNGPGIRPDVLSRVFDPFFTTKPVGKGTGLGLSLSYGIIQEHGGNITARSEAGHGAEFIIELPVAVEKSVAVVVGEKTTASAFPFESKEGKSVLVVDDEVWILQLTEELLTQDGYTVVTASNGEKALELIAGQKFDVVVSDWKMPGLSGPRLYEQLRAIEPDLAERIVFMTGDVMNETFQEFLIQWEIPCLPKPFAIGDFRVAVARVTNDQR